MTTVHDLVVRARTRDVFRQGDEQATSQQPAAQPRPASSLSVDPAPQYRLGSSMIHRTTSSGLEAEADPSRGPCPPPTASDLAYALREASRCVSASISSNVTARELCPGTCAAGPSSSPALPPRPPFAECISERLGPASAAPRFRFRCACETLLHASCLSRGPPSRTHGHAGVRPWGTSPDEPHLPPFAGFRQACLLPLPVTSRRAQHVGSTAGECRFDPSTSQRALTSSTRPQAFDTACSGGLNVVRSSILMAAF